MGSDELLPKYGEMRAWNINKEKKWNKNQSLEEEEDEEALLYSEKWSRIKKDEEVRYV